MRGARKARRPPSDLPSDITTGIFSSMGDEHKVRENRMRRMADRQGLHLAKSRRRDPRAVDYGTYMLVDAHTNSVVSSGLQGGYGMTLDEVEEHLMQ